MTLTNPTQLRVLGALVAALFAAGVFGLVTESGDDGDELGTSSTTSSSTSPSSLPSSLPSTSVGSATTAPLSPTTSLLPTATSEATTTTTTTGGAVNVAGGSGLGSGGSASVTGSGQMADTGAEDFFLPGALLLGAALGGRRLLASSRD